MWSLHTKPVLQSYQHSFTIIVTDLELKQIDTQTHNKIAMTFNLHAICAGELKQCSISKHTVKDVFASKHSKLENTDVHTLSLSHTCRHTHTLSQKERGFELCGKSERHIFLDCSFILINF